MDDPLSTALPVINVLVLVASVPAAALDPAQSAAEPAEVQR